MAKFRKNWEKPGGTLTALRTIKTRNSQNNMLSSPPVISAMPAIKSPSTRLLVTTVHCTSASGNRSAFSKQRGKKNVGQNVKPENELNRFYRHIQQARRQPKPRR